MLGIGTVLSFNRWSSPLFGDKTFFELLDYLTANILLPLGELLISLFAGWLLSRKASLDELAIGEGLAYRIWRVLASFVVPLAVAIVFLNAIGLSKEVERFLTPQQGP